MTAELVTCMPIYARTFSSEQWPEAAVGAAEEIIEKLGVSLDYVACTHNEGRSAALRSERDYRWDSRSRERLDALLKIGNPESLGFTAGKPRNAYPDAWVDIGAGDPYHLFYVEWSDVSAQGGPPHYHFQFFLELLSVTTRVLDPLYALVTRMRADALPAFYFITDSDVPQMTPQESANLSTWYEKRESFCTKLRGVYWGNLLSAGHLSAFGGAEPFAQSIAPIVGRHLIARLEDDKVFFMLPDMGESRLAVERLIVKAGLLMDPSAEAKEAWK